MLANRPENERFILCGGPVANGSPFPSFKNGELEFVLKADLVLLHPPAEAIPTAHPVGDTGFAAYSFTGAQDSFEAYVTCKPQHCHVIIGYTGWGPGQLEGEMAAGLWVPVEATEDLVFRTPPDQLWDACAAIAKSNESVRPLFDPDP
jgi:hypothetical protein